MGLIGTDLTPMMTVSVPDIQLTHELSDDDVATLPVPGLSLAAAIDSYLETVQVLSRITTD